MKYSTIIAVIILILLPLDCGSQTAKKIDKPGEKGDLKMTIDSKIESPIEPKYVKFKDSSRDHKDALKFFELGYEKQLQKNFEDAIKNYRLAIKASEDTFEFHYNLGLCLKETKKYDEALLEFEKVTSLNKRYKTAYKHLGDVYEALGRSADSQSAHAAYSMF